MMKGICWGLILTLFGLGLAPMNAVDAASKKDQRKNERMTLEQILTEHLAEGDYVDTKSCINLDRVKQTEVLDARHIVLKISSKRYWMATLNMRCPGMRAGVSLQFDKRSRWICRGDSVRAPFNSAAEATRWGPPCNLSTFQAITSGQLKFVREALRAHRR